MINVGVVGYGYWGPNLVRNFNIYENTKVLCVCDKIESNLRKAKAYCPIVNTTLDYNTMLNNKNIDLIVIATPVNTHYELADRALSVGKHVLVEKPITTSVVQAKKLIEKANKKSLRLMVDHTFLFTGAVTKINELIKNDELGKLFYYDSTRINLGIFQPDINVVWDLATHDLAIINFLFNKKPISISVNGIDHFNNGRENIAYITIYFEDNIIIHLNVNWMSPVKVRTVIIGGENKIIIWDDLQSDRKISVYDKSAIPTSANQVEYRIGDLWCPSLILTEAIFEMCKHVYECITENKKSIIEGEEGLKVVRLLEAADKSLQSGGKELFI
jgi:predicted dehydrogenase